MSEISFQLQIPFTSDFPATMINGISRTLSGFFPGTMTEVGADNRFPVGVQAVRCTPGPFPESITFTDVTALEFPYSRLNDMSVDQVVNLATFKLGTDGTVSYYFVVDLKCTAKASNNVTYSQKYYIRKTEPGTPPNVIITETVIQDWTSMGIIYQTTGTVLNARFRFGFNLVKLPGREDDPKNYLLWYCYTNAVKSNNTATYYTPPQSPLGETIMSYNMLSYTQTGNGNVYAGALIDFSKLYDVYGVEPSIKIYSPQAGEESVQGGMNEPAFDDRSDTVALPDNPTLDLCTMGFYNVYTSGSVDALNHLREYLFGSPITTQSTTEDILKAIGNNLFNSKLTDYIVSCHLIPVAPVTGDTPTVTAINLGNVTCTDATMSKVTTDYVTFDCGSISLSEYYENFADFLESSKIFLPFIGFVPCRPEWFKNTTLSVQYKFNVIDGSCIAFIMSTGKYTNNGNSGTTVVGQYSGTASIRFPITGVSYASMATGVVGSIAAMSVASGAGSILGVAGSAINMAQQKPEIAQSNGYNACASMLGVRRPFLYIERPVSSYARNYQHELGIPSNIFATLGSLSGYVRMDNVHLDGIPCTDEERAYIADALKKGIIV